MQMVPTTFRDACNFVAKRHRHHPTPVGHKFSLAVEEGVQVVSVAIAGRPPTSSVTDGLWRSDGPAASPA